MKRLRAPLLFGVLLFLPATVFAQATLAGVIRDSSDAVLPGVTVEVSSPAMIEKTRTAVTDGDGQYRDEACLALYRDGTLTGLRPSSVRGRVSGSG